MQTQTQTPISGGPKPRPRSGRTPLQPKNSPADPRPKPKLKPDVEPRFEITPIRDSDDKENRQIAAAASSPAPPLKASPQPQLPDASSLAEELSAFKKKLEKMRIDKENTERTLKEKDAKLDAMMKELEDRGEVQKKLEIEVDRLFRLKELKYRCMRVSPIRTLREKEHGKIVNEAPSSSHSQSELKTEETVSFECESDGEECQVQSPGSACSQTDNAHTKDDN